MERFRNRGHSVRWSAVERQSSRALAFWMTHRLEEEASVVIRKEYLEDVEAIVGRRHDQGGDFWATEDGRWGKGSPFSTFDCVLILTELGMKRSDPVLRGAACEILASWREDGRFRPAPKGTIFPCHTANAARVLCRLGFARDRRLKRTFDHLLDVQHDDGGWRCNTVKLGRSDRTDASNPGVTLAALDAFRFTPLANDEPRLDRAARSLLAHWKTRKPLGPCHFGIGSRFLQVEYPFLRYNLFFYVYVLSFYEAARKDARFRQALRELESKLEDGKVVVENPNRRLAKLAFCRKGEASKAATRRYEEIRKNVGG